MLLSSPIAPFHANDGGSERGGWRRNHQFMFAGRLATTTSARYIVVLAAPIVTFFFLSRLFNERFDISMTWDTSAHEEDPSKIEIPISAALRTTTIWFRVLFIAVGEETRRRRMLPNKKTKGTVTAINQWKKTNKKQHGSTFYTFDDDPPLIPFGWNPKEKGGPNTGQDDEIYFHVCWHVWRRFHSDLWDETKTHHPWGRPKDLRPLLDPRVIIVSSSTSSEICPTWRRRRSRASIFV